MAYEYKVIPAPTRGQKGKGIKGPEGRFANALESAINTLAQDGWEYVRADTLPSEERSGLTGSTTSYRSVLVFRRATPGDVAGFQPETLSAPTVAELPAPAAAQIPQAEAPEAGAGKVGDDDTALILQEDDKTGTSAAKDPDEGETVADINVALKQRVETLERDEPPST